MSNWVLLILCLLIIGNAFFVGAEFGLVSARRSVIELRALNGSRLARITLQGMERVSLMLAAAQLGVTLCSLGLGALGEPYIAHLLAHPLAVLGVPEVGAHIVSIGIALLLMTYLHVVFGEMIPKNIALASADRTALILTPPLLGLVRVFYPIVIALNGLASLCTRALGVSPKDEIASAFTRDEVAGFVEESHREGLLSKDEERLLKGSLRFDEKMVDSIILPLKTMVVVAAGATPADVEQLVATTGYSRFPVQGREQRLIGYVHLKDMLDIAAEDYQKPLNHDEIRPLPIVKNRDSLHDAITVMQRSGAHMAQVANNRGRILGILMLEDALEDLVGEIRDDTQTTSTVEQPNQ